MILDVIVEDKKKRLVQHKKKISEAEMRWLAEEAGKGKRAEKSFYDALTGPDLAIIGEFKKASPSLGSIAQTMDLTERIDDYNASVDAISCLTEEDHFLGNVDYFRQIRDMTSLPMIRKDFIVDPYQIYEARAIGADCILLIAAILDDARLADYYQLARELSLDVLMETHDEDEMERVLKIQPRIVGVNNRNLKDFTISLDNTKRLRPMVPEGTAFVSESGVTKDEHIRFLAACQVDALLIGGAFMFSDHPRDLADHWKELYRKAVSCRQLSVRSDVPVEQRVLCEKEDVQASCRPRGSVETNPIKQRGMVSDDRD